MAKRKQASPPPDEEQPAKTFRKRILTANFTSYPGGVAQFDDSTLQSEGLLRLMRELEKAFTRGPGFAMLEEALAAQFPPRERKSFYRWFILVCRQNQLRGEEIQRLREDLRRVRRLNDDLYNEQSEGTFFFSLRAILNGKKPWDPEVRQQEEAIRRAWREKRRMEQDEENEKQFREYERRRKRSGTAPTLANPIDWTKPHTALEYVGAIAEKSVHVKRVQEFLRPFRGKAQRRGRGRNKPLEYPFEAGLALFETAVTHWVDSDAKRKLLLFIVSASQVSLASALTAEGLRMREVLARLWSRHPSAKLESGTHLGDLVETDETWRLWHQVILSRGGVTERPVF